MHTTIIVASVLLPLLGVMRMEAGAFGNSIGMYGYPNGATVAYALYASVLLGAYFALRIGPAVNPIVRVQRESRFGNYAKLLIILLLLLLLVMLFAFGGYAIWLGQIGKGDFRANLGRFGAVAYLLTNSLVPLLMAYACVLYRYPTQQRSWHDRRLLVVLFGLTLLIGSTWGFKATGITMLLPALIVLFWSANSGRVMAAIIAITLTIVVFFYLFDSKTDEAAAGIDFLLTRLTTLQGDVSWQLWNQYSEEAAFPPYLQTLLVFVGDNAFSALSGIERDVLDLWADYHFDILVGQLVGLPLSVVKEGHSIVGTPFADGLVLGGVPGVIAIALFTGLLCGVLITLIEHSLSRGQDYLSAVFVTYFGISVVTFLRNGVAIQLIQIATVVGLLLALAICIGLNRLASNRIERNLFGSVTQNAGVKKIALYVEK